MPTPLTPVPVVPTDALGNRVDLGTKVCWTYGTKYNLRFGTIERINYKRPWVGPYGDISRTRVEDCPPGDPNANQYTLTLLLREPQVTKTYKGERVVRRATIPGRSSTFVSIDYPDVEE